MADKKPTNSLLTGDIMIHVYYMCMCAQLHAGLYMRHIGTVPMKVRRRCSLEMAVQAVAT